MLEKLASLSQFQVELLAIYLLLQGVLLAIIPEEVIILSLGVLWGQGRVGFLDSFLALLIGLIPANLIMAIIGNKVGRKIISIPPFSWAIPQEHLEKALTYLKRYGSLTIFITRFTPVIRGPIYLAVGISHFSFLKFIRVDALASLIYIPVLLSIGKMIGTHYPVEDVYRGIVIVSLSCFAVSILVVAFEIMRKKMTRGKA